MNLTIDQIRKEYPNPTTSEAAPIFPDANGTYCVGGALCLYSKKHNLINETIQRKIYAYMPNHQELGIVLEAINPNLDPGTAEETALRIIEANDEARFELAYSLLDEALTYTK